MDMAQGSQQQYEFNFKSWDIGVSFGGDVTWKIWNQTDVFWRRWKYACAWHT